MGDEDDVFAVPRPKPPKKPSLPVISEEEPEYESVPPGDEAELYTRPRHEPGFYKEATTDEEEFLPTEDEGPPDTRFVETDGSESEREVTPPPNFNAIGSDGGIDMASLAVVDKVFEASPLVQPAQTKATLLIEDAEPEECVLPSEPPVQSPEPVFYRVPPPPPPLPPQVILEPPQRQRGTSVLGAFFVIAFLLTWATLD